MSRKIQSILFVCAGNMCRSPIAEAAFRHIAKSRPALAGISVGSAGSIALDGDSAPAEAVRAALEAFGEDLSSHRARNVDPLDADLILTVDRSVTRDVLRLGKRGRVVMLGEYAGTNEPVSDPFGCGDTAFQVCARHIRSLMEKVAQRVEEENEGRPRRTGRREGGD
jgi:low molecular weight protein-tyrosine phosphatase